MSARLGALVSRHWFLVILFWLVALVVVRLVAPAWDTVTEDGDFAFLPEGMPSVVGEQLTRDAFPASQTKSQIALIVAREDAPLSERDLQVGDDLSKRVHNLLGVALFASAQKRLQQRERLLQAGEVESITDTGHQAEQSLAAAGAAFDEALRLDPEFAIALHNRGLLHKHHGLIADSERDAKAAITLSQDLAHSAGMMLPQAAADLPLLDVWTRDNEVFGSKLVSEDKQAVLIVLHLHNEFMASDNIRVLSVVGEEIEAARRFAADVGAEGVVLGVSGSAAVGADLLTSAAESIQNTELFTIVFVVVILSLVYRAPFVVIVPLITIGVSLSLSTGILALLTQLDDVLGISWWGFKVFNTTRIFVVVILFGAGTDFCLFLIARLKEETRYEEDCGTAVARSVTGVSAALIASALTTIVGLGMMFFADFGKFRSSGPAIGLCLGVALMACLTLAPALLRAMGPVVFWPQLQRGIGRRRSASERITSSFWSGVARIIVARPGSILALSLAILAPLALVGLKSDGNVTFDLLAELDQKRPSILGGKLLQEHFSVGESGPVIVLAKLPGAAFGGEGEAGTKSLVAIQQLTIALSNVPGVTAVRSLAEPLGDTPQRLSILSSAGRRKLFLREHRLTKSIFVAQAPEVAGDVTRFELVLDVMPFSREALDALTRIEDRLRSETRDLNSFWSRAEFAFTGTTAGIRDLREVTRSDQRRIQVLVVLAVLAVLWLVLRRLVICVYLIASVVLSYLVTIGATDLYFQWLYGDTFDGLDWKVPIFLFVILVAVGEDYNIYLVTRVFEEQGKIGPFAGLRAALVKTGGIITSCGLIMAGTFVSMTSGTLRGIVELGFALSLGVLLDTFVVRTILVPAFLALYCRFTSGPLLRRDASSRNLRSSD